MRLSTSAHASRPWRIHDLTPDFRVEDVWALPTPGGRHDLGRLVGMMASRPRDQESSGVVGLLWSARQLLGRLFGWDDDEDGLGGRVASLRERLPADLRDTPRPEFAGLPFRSVYQTDDEFAAEIANRTMHGVLHLGWVPDGTGGYHGQMAVLVKPNGLLGAAYMAGIRPFRHLAVYPAMLRRIERDWPRARHRTG